MLADIAWAQSQSGPGTGGTLLSLVPFVLIFVIFYVLLILPQRKRQKESKSMQENLKKAQEELASVEVTGQSGGGMVQITLTGKMECRKVRIEPSVLSDPEMAEDLLTAAFNDAVNKVNAASQERMSQATAGMPLPPGMKLPF